MSLKESDFTGQKTVMQGRSFFSESDLMEKPEPFNPIKKSLEKPCKDFS